MNADVFPAVVFFIFSGEKRQPEIHLRSQANDREVRRVLGGLRFTISRYFAVRKLQQVLFWGSWTLVRILLGTKRWEESW